MPSLVTFPLTGAALATLVLLGAATADKGEWKVLFDGKSTDAWRGYGRDAFPAGCWIIEGDTLKTVTGGKGPCDIVTREPYRDFELELEYKLTPGGNSGVLYRVAELPGEPSWHSGPEMQILDDDKYRTNSPKNWTGALYDLIAAPSDKVVHPVGEWNKVRVLVRDNHVEHWLNGRKAVEYDLGSVALKTLIAGSKFKDMPRFAREPEGYIALQHHDGGDVWFRNVRVRSLSAPAASGARAGSAPSGAKEKGWVSLFNGKDLTGWKAHGQERWTVDQGEIHGEAVTKEYGYLSTEKPYRDFELKAKFKAEGTGNSGVFYHSSLDGVDIKGVQVEVDPHPGMHTGGLYESAGRGWLVQPNEAAEKALVVGGWNEVRAVVRGPHVQTWVNGVPAVDYTDASPKYTDGLIALQLHAGGEGKMRFKDIVVRELE
jgi:3-keto-disaccharide hydrolase